MLDRLYRFFTSLRLTVVLLACGFVLVFWGTLAQVNLGLYRAQHEFFRSLFIYWSPAGTGWRVPVFPGGYLIGGLLLVNLFAAHLWYYRQLLTDLLATESLLHLRHGETKNYSEASGRYELAVVDKSDAATDEVVAIPGRRLERGGAITHPALPFTLRLERFHGNSTVAERELPGYEAVPAKAGVGPGLWWRPLPRVTETDQRDMPSGLITVAGPAGPVGTFFVSAFLARPQAFTYQERRYEMALRPARYYKPFSIQLLEFRHDRYPGTEIPKNFSSRVRLHRPDTGEEREVLIYMNNPLRYAGEAYYQASFDKDDRGTVLQVVRNPSWLTPYLACVLVGVGLTIQFVTHLVGFARKRRAS
jgi:hypothetical protein